MIKKNLANIITCLRIVLIPVVLWLISIMSTTQVDAAHYWALGVFVFAASTDFIDGQIARRTNTISEFGKLVDPLADRLLVISVLIALMWRNFMPIWMGVLIVGRDVLMLVGAPIIGINDKEVRERLAVHWTGKAATALLFTAICTFILWNLPEVTTTIGFPGKMNPIGLVIFCAGIVFSYASAFIYIRRGIALVRERGGEEGAES